MTSWIFFSILAGFIWAATNIVDSFVVNNHIENIRLKIAPKALLTLVVALLILALSDSFLYSLSFAIYGFLSGLSTLVASQNYLKAAQEEEISRIVPLFALVSVFLTIFGYLQGERFSAITYFGILSIVVGSVLIMYKRNERKSSSISFRVLVLMILSSLLYAIAILFLDHLVDKIGFWHGFAYALLGYTVAAIPIIYTHRKEVVRLSSRAFKLMILADTGDILASISFSAALSLGSAALVNALSDTQHLFIFFMTLALHRIVPTFLNEKVNLQTVLLKAISIVLIITGSIIIGLT